MQYQPKKLEARRRTIIVSAYKVSLNNLEWLRDNITDVIALTPDLKGVLVRTKWGTTPAIEGMIIVVNDNDKAAVMTRKNFDNVYEVVRTCYPQKSKNENLKKYVEK